VTWIDTAGLGKSAQHSDDAGTSIYNVSEINTVLSVLKSVEADSEFCDLLASILKEGEAGIGVICMYGEQKRRLRRKFHEQEWSEEFKNLVKIDTVDSYQGKENRIVILSLTRNHPSAGPGFLKESNRINVSMSRAMDRLLIVGSTQMWTGRNEGTPLNKVLAFIHERDKPDYAFLAAENLLNRGHS
jgi:superfamily I DNA and/or RNA helicase